MESYIQLNRYVAIMQLDRWKCRRSDIQMDREICRQIVGCIQVDKQKDRYIDIQRDRKKCGQKNSLIDGQIGRQIDRQIDRQKFRYTDG